MALPFFDFTFAIRTWHHRRSVIRAVKSVHSVSPAILYQPKWDGRRKVISSAKLMAVKCISVFHENIERRMPRAGEEANNVSIRKKNFIRKEFQKTIPRIKIYNILFFLIKFKNEWKRISVDMYYNKKILFYVSLFVFLLCGDWAELQSPSQSETKTIRLRGKGE